MGLFAPILLTGKKTLQKIQGVSATAILAQVLII